MIPTVQPGEILENRSDDEDRTKLFNALRRAANLSYRSVFKATTTTIAPTAIWTSADMPQNSAWEVLVSVQAASAFTPAGYQRVGRFGRASGASFALGATHTPIPDDEIDPSMDVALANFGNGVRLTVVGVAGQIKWSAFVEIREAA